MAYIGMRSPIAAKLAAERVDGTPLSYETPIVIGPAVQADITYDVADNPDYGDDVIIDNDKGVNGYNITLETNDICKEARAACMGWNPVTVTENNVTTITHYEVTGDAPPEVGLGFIRVKLFKSVTTYEGFFFHAMQFSNGGEHASTKQRQITWNHPSMTGAGIGVYPDDSGKAKFFDWMEFEDFDDALTWIYGKFGTNPPSTTTGTGT